MYGTGIELLCGSTVIVALSQFGNFWTICALCGMEVSTAGCSPDTDKVHEYRRDM